MRSPEPVTRPRLVPTWAIAVPVALFLAGAAVVVFALLGLRMQTVSVPNVTNLDLATAKEKLAEAGLTLKTGDKRFSANVPIDSVMDQSPAPGVVAPKGTAITVVLSGGSESFTMPDVTGVLLDAARALLQSKGLVVQVEVVSSARTKNTVVSSDPGAGVTVSSSNVVKLAVSSGATGTAVLQPADLTGRTFVIDPAPASTGVTDTPMEVERRLNALLAASGAQVVVTRSITDTSSLTTPVLRSQRARVASGTAIIGLDVRSAGDGGLGVSSLQSAKTTPEAYLASAQLAQGLTSTLNGLQRVVKASETGSDTVIQDAKLPGVRVSLGSATDANDKARLTDPSWEDSVASGIYQAIAKLYGRK